jgi:hypothetical protein
MMSPAKRAWWLAVFAVAMGILEAVVVVYLRELYYPGGFRFPIVPMPARIALAEGVREAATILMLLAAAVLARRRGVDGFFVFAFLFGVWDLVYYAGLFCFLRWPESMGTWDILFLIPVPWLAPVACPVVVSLLLVAGFVTHEIAEASGRTIAPSRLGWAVAVVGAVGVVASFCFRFRDVLDGRVPRDFPWTFFWASLAAAAGPFVRASIAAFARTRPGMAPSGR